MKKEEEVDESSTEGEPGQVGRKGKSQRHQSQRVSILSICLPEPNTHRHTHIHTFRIKEKAKMKIVKMKRLEKKYNTAKVQNKSRSDFKVWRSEMHFIFSFYTHKYN